MLNRFTRYAAGLMAMTCAALSPAHAEDTADQLMERNFFVTKVSAMRVQMTMQLIAPDSQKRERKMETTSKLQKNGIDSNLIVRFQYPADIKGTAFLEVERIDADDDIWIYLPALQKVRRIVANNKKDSFMGSDFSYGEMLPPRVEAYKHTLLGTETIDGLPCGIVQSIPASDKVRDDSGYSKKVTWLDKNSALEVKVDYYDLEGKLLKVQRVHGPKLVDPEKNKWLAQVREMTNVQTGHKTVVSLDEIDTHVSLSDAAFSTRAIEGK